MISKQKVGFRVCRDINETDVKNVDDKKKVNRGKIYR